MKNYTPENITELQSNEVFVFGSNRNGNHMGGAAAVAYTKFGAEWGIGEGLMGKSYALPTLNEGMEKVTEKELEDSFVKLLEFADQNRQMTFLVTKVGCGIAGWDVETVKKIFWQAAAKVSPDPDWAGIPSNVRIPKEFCNEDKGRRIEQWAQEVERCKKRELSTKEAIDFSGICMNEGAIDSNSEDFIKDLENKKLGLASAFWLRIKYLHTYSITPSAAMFLVSHVIKNFGISTMMAAYLQYIAHQHGIKRIGIKEFSMWAFPFGLPTNEEWERLWNLQKIPMEEREGGMSDNTLDHPGVYGTSIWEIKEK